MQVKKNVFILFVLFPFFTFVYGQSGSINWNKTNPWVDSIYSAMSDDERIGQLFMVDVWTLRDSNHFNYIETLVKRL